MLIKRQTNPLNRRNFGMRQTNVGPGNLNQQEVLYDIISFKLKLNREIHKRIEFLKIYRLL